MKRGRRDAIFLLLWIFLWAVPAMGEAVRTSGITEANRFYHQNEFEKAVKLYEKEIARGVENGHLYFNLGNAFFRMGDLPRAILNYLKARKYLPRDEDVEANLEYAVRQTVDQLDWRNPRPLDSVFFWAQDFTLEEHWIALLWVNLIFWITLAYRLHRRTPALQTSVKFLLGLLVLILLSTGWRWTHETRRTGVILDNQVDIHSDWNRDSVTLFKLNSGAVIDIQKEKNEWVLIELPDKSRGWALQSSVID